jgi:two-component system NarL family sensor kinase
LLVIAEALLHRRWFGINVVLNRSLVYGTLTVAVLAAYGSVVVGVDAVLPKGASLVGGAVVAIVFAPVRSRVQLGVDRLMYGERRDPYSAVARLGERLESRLTPDQVLPVIVASIAESLRLTFVEVEATDVDGNHLTATWGIRSTAELERIDLSFGGDVTASLAVEPRPGETKLGDHDRRLLTDLARHAGVAVHAVAVGAALQRSREQLVGLLEEERRRMRRDLHDGLGPALTAVTLQLDVLANVLRTEPSKAQAIVVELRGEVKDAIAAIRRLVYDLRPPALDELGLLGALREHARRLGRDVAMAIEGDDLPTLPAAVEVAAYRIVIEAMTNVARHSGASSCTIRVSYDECLELSIEDDGVGVTSDWCPGVGLRSIYARTAELGGTCSITAAPSGGGIVRARLPVNGR